MRGWGITLLIIGIGSYILPTMGLQFKLISIFGDSAPAAGIVAAIIGVVMIIFGPRAA